MSSRAWFILRQNHGLVNHFFLAPLQKLQFYIREKVVDRWCKLFSRQTNVKTVNYYLMRHLLTLSVNINLGQSNLNNHISGHFENRKYCTVYISCLKSRENLFLHTISSMTKLISRENLTLLIVHLIRICEKLRSVKRIEFFAQKLLR